MWNEIIEKDKKYFYVINIKRINLLG